MFTLTTTQAVVLAVGWLAVTAGLVLGVLVGVPRSRRRVPARVTCPMLNASVTAQLLRDDWTRRFTAVMRCEPLGGCARVLCNESCLHNRSATPLMGAA